MCVDRIFTKSYLIYRLSNDLTEFGYKMATKSDHQERGVKRRHIDSRCFV